MYTEFISEAVYSNALECNQMKMCQKFLNLLTENAFMNKTNFSPFFIALIIRLFCRHEEIPLYNDNKVFNDFQTINSL